MIWISRVLLIASLTVAVAVTAGLVWATRGDLLSAEAIRLPRHQVIAWHRGADFRLTICKYHVDPVTGAQIISGGGAYSGFYLPWVERLLSVVFEFSLWKALAISLIYPAIAMVVTLLRRANSNRAGFPVIPAERQAT